MDTNIDELLRKIEALKISPSPLSKKAKDLESLKAQLRQGKDRVAALRPSDKDYPEQLAKLGNLWNTLKLQVEAAEIEINQSVTEAKQFAVDHGDEAIGLFSAETHELDGKIIVKLLEVYNLVHERQAAAIQQRLVSDILSGFAFDLGVDPSNWAPVLPGGERITDSAKQACAYILRRFARMIELRNVPIQDEDPVKWFDIRRPF
jgi:hypothetical protein